MRDKFGKSELTIKDFQLKNNGLVVKNSHQKGLILFYSGECGYCIMLSPEWQKFIDKYSDQYFIGAVHILNRKGGNHKLFQIMQVQGYPDIRYVDKEGIVNMDSYKGEINIKSFRSFLSSK